MVTCLTHSRSIEHFIAECEVKKILILYGDHEFVKYMYIMNHQDHPINFYE